MRVKTSVVLLGMCLGVLTVRANADADTFGLTARWPDAEKRFVLTCLLPQD